MSSTLVLHYGSDVHRLHVDPGGFSNLLLLRLQISSITGVDPDRQVLFLRCSIAPGEQQEQDDVDEEDEDAGVRQVREAARGGGRAIRADYRGREQDRRERGEEGPPLHQSLRVLRDLQREAVREQEREDGERVEGLRRLRARHRARGGRAAMRRALHK